MAKQVAFYKTERGDEPVREFLQELPKEARQKCGQYLRMLQEWDTLPASHARHLEGPIWELRPESGGIEYRLLYCIDGGMVIVLLVGFLKKTQRTPRVEIEKAKERRDAYLAAKENR